MTTQNFIFKTKLILLLVLLVTGSFIFKYFYTSWQSKSEAVLSQSEINNLKQSVADECLKSEEANLSKGNNLDEDLEWFKLKAPEYCKCVSLRVYSLIIKDNDFKQLLDGHKGKDIKEKAVSYLKNNRLKGLTDFCLSKAQKTSVPKRQFASDHSVSQPTTLPFSK